jgi:hypothetical protein
MSKSTRQTGAYYLTRSKKYWEDLGWNVEKLEVPQYFFMKGKMIMGGRKDLLGADLGIWKDKEFFLVQVKFGDARSISIMRCEAIRNFDKVSVPLKKIIQIWQPRKTPITEYL